MFECESFGEGFLAKLNLWAVEHCVPFSTTFELTPFCNFRCPMCYVRLEKHQAQKQGEMLKIGAWLEIARQLRDMGTLRITLTGGEVFTHPQFWELYGELNKMGFWISILSNGYLIDDDAMEKFRFYGMPHSVKLSIYGASDEMYAEVCGVKSGFTRLGNAVRLLKEAGVPTTMNATVIRENADDLQAMYFFAHENRIPFQHTIAVLKSSRGAENTAESSRLGFIDFSKELTVDDLEKSRYPAPENPFSLCASFRKSLFITWNGHFQLCSFLSEPYIQYSGNTSDDFKKLYEKLSDLKSPAECENCRWKEFCQRCPGILCAESGHPEKTDKNFCETARQLWLLYDNKKKGI